MQTHQGKEPLGADGRGERAAGVQHPGAEEHRHRQRAPAQRQVPVPRRAGPGLHPGRRVRAHCPGLRQERCGRLQLHHLRVRACLPSAWAQCSGSGGDRAVRKRWEGKALRQRALLCRNRLLHVPLPPSPPATSAWTARFRCRYGQTGSGKTYSITGGTRAYDERGIIPRVLGDLFERIEQQSAAKFLVCVWQEHRPS
jgi:hypothetical protein